MSVPPLPTVIRLCDDLLLTAPIELANTKRGGSFLGDDRQRLTKAFVPAMSGSVEDIEMLKSTRQAIVMIY